MSLLALGLAGLQARGQMVDVTDAVGLGSKIVPEVVPRVAFADLNRDGWPDLVVNRHRVFLNKPDIKSPIGRQFREIPLGKTGLQAPLPGTATVFADLDNDGKLDALVSESAQVDDPKWKDHGRRTRWHKGKGDGTFLPHRSLPVPPRPTIAIAVGDLNRDGRLDLFFGNSYRAGETFEAFPGDLLLNLGRHGWKHVEIPRGGPPFHDETDLGPRPTYGVMVASIDGGQPGILALSYGRRWNRFWIEGPAGNWRDLAPRLGLDGDDLRVGEYPAWLVEYAKTRPQYPSKPEKPFRSNGNTFDASVGDVDSDGRFDVFLSEITHAWAGDSSDRSRLLFQQPDGTFRPRAGYLVDRIPDYQRWNQGDLFSELVDMDLDGELDLLISSGDYPDQHLHLYLQRNGAFANADELLGVKHDGSQQLSLGDIDGDGAPDMAVGQTFFRLNAEQIGGRSPHLRILLNRLGAQGRSLTLRLQGDRSTVNSDALGAIVRFELDGGRSVKRQLIGIGGHAGKQHDLVVFVGLGSSRRVKTMEITWPDRKGTRKAFRNVAHGDYSLRMGGKLIRLR